MTGALSAAPAAAQRLELRVGAVASSALVSDAIASGASTVQATARPAPLVGIAFLQPLRAAVSLEAGAAYAASNLRARDAGGSWGGDALGVWQALVGVRYRPGSRTRPDSLAGAYARAAAGGVHYASRQSIFEAGSPIEPALEVAGGWNRAVGAWLAGAEVGAQVHAFAPQTLRQEGGSSGSVKRGFLLLTLSRRLGR